MNKFKYHNIAVALILLLGASQLIGQNTYKKSFNVDKDILVSVNTSHTNVVIETWDKNKVEVEAFVEGKDLSETEKKEIFDNWKFEVIGNNKNVTITSNEGSLWGGVESMRSLKSLERLNELDQLEGLKELEGLKALQSLSGLKELADMDWNIVVPDLPNFRKFPNWPFTKERPSLKSGDGYVNYNFNNDGENSFDRDKYEKNKQEYVAKLNKKYATSVSVQQTDAWLVKVDSWAKEFEGVMEKWGENFGNEFEQKFGPEFERKMEKWGEEFGKDMEKWGEEFGEKFEEQIEEWGEKFGKDMEKWSEQFEKDVEKWAEQFEEDSNHSIHLITTDDKGNKSIIKSNSKGGLFENNSKAKKTIIIRMPKGSETDINVRHGKVKMADAFNLKATLNYASLTANSIDGDKTLINAAYAPVMVNNWNAGELRLEYVEDCRLNKVKEIMLDANSSDVNINVLDDSAILSGSFGNLFINTIASQFNSLDISLENTDATLSIPNTAFTFYYNGKKSRFESPSHLQITTKNKNESRSLLKGFYKNENTKKAITINASYSNVRFN